MRSLVIGQSGCGKSSLVIQKYLLEKCPIHKKYYLDYNTLIIVSPSKDQFLYQWLIKCYEAKLHRIQIVNIFRALNGMTRKDAEQSTSYISQNIKAQLAKLEEHDTPLNDIEILLYSDTKDLHQGRNKRGASR